jgi:hypothetical protein
MLESVREKDSCSEVVFEAPNIPASVLGAIATIDILKLPGKYGDPRNGRPIEYDRLTIDHDAGSVTIEFFNRAISLFMSESEIVKRIHRTMCAIQMVARN